MNDIEDDRGLQRLFAAYDPAITAEPFLEQTLARLNREIRRARMRTAMIYGLAAVAAVGLAATTAVPMNIFLATLEKNWGSFAGSLSPLKSQVLIYAATLGLLALARHRLRAFLEPW
jgi:hypothetical protein